MPTALRLEAAGPELSLQVASTGAGGRLAIDLGALAANYRLLAEAAAPAECAAVVKADAYGIEVRHAVPALLAAGCRTFFVADVNEAAAVAPMLPPFVSLFVLGGVHPGSESAWAATGALPVLNSLSQARRWQVWCEASGRPQPAAVQIDTGMSRLGMTADDLRVLAQDPAFGRAVPLRLVMSHLACADLPNAAANPAQLDAFIAAAQALPDVPRSLANSAGILMESAYRFDLVRPGIALYGGAPFVDDGRTLAPVAFLDARVVQVRTIEAGTGVGYGLTFTADTRRRIATLAVGYADGWPRALSARGAAYHRGQRLPIVGRISMDSMSIDISELADDALGEGDWVELLGTSQSVDAVAKDAGTISYEILTSLGRRYARSVRSAFNTSTRAAA